MCEECAELVAEQFLEFLGDIKGSVIRVVAGRFAGTALLELIEVGYVRAVELTRFDDEYGGEFCIDPALLKGSHEVIHAPEDDAKVFVGGDGDGNVKADQDSSTSRTRCTTAALKSPGATQCRS